MQVEEQSSPSLYCREGEGNHMNWGRNPLSTINNDEFFFTILSVD